MFVMWHRSSSQFPPALPISSRKTLSQASHLLPHAEQLPKLPLL